MRRLSDAFLFVCAVVLACSVQDVIAQQIVTPSIDAIKKVKILTVALEEEEHGTGKTRPLEGRLYSRQPDSARRVHIADVDVSGRPSPEVECAAGEKLEAEARKELVINKTGPQFCKERLRFVFEPLRFGTAKADLSTAMRFSAAEQWGAAAASYSDISYSLRSTRPLAALVIQDAAIAAGAKALGDHKLDRFVLRDPSQKYRLVFSEQGVEEIRKFQRNKGLRETAMLDAATLRALRQKD